ncbi:MAG: glycosyl transferase, partial [Nitrosopumilaceae archaeon]
DHLIDAVWARDFSSLWHGLKRLMVPLYLQNNTIAVGIFFAVLFLLFMPFPILVYSAPFWDRADSFFILVISSSIASILVYVGAITEATQGLQLKLSHALMAPLGSLVVVIGFLSGIIQAKSDAAISWRGRSYSLKDHTQNSIKV